MRGQRDIGQVRLNPPLAKFSGRDGLCLGIPRHLDLAQLPGPAVSAWPQRPGDVNSPAGKGQPLLAFREVFVRAGDQHQLEDDRGHFDDDQQQHQQV